MAISNLDKYKLDLDKKVKAGKTKQQLLNEIKKTPSTYTQYGLARGVAINVVGSFFLTKTSKVKETKKEEAGYSND